MLLIRWHFAYVRKGIARAASTRWQLHSMDIGMFQAIVIIVVVISVYDCLFDSSIGKLLIRHLSCNAAPLLPLLTMLLLLLPLLPPQMLLLLHTLLHTLMLVVVVPGVAVQAHRACAQVLAAITVLIICQGRSVPINGPRQWRLDSIGIIRREHSERWQQALLLVTGRIIIPGAAVNGAGVTSYQPPGHHDATSVSICCVDFFIVPANQHCIITCHSIVLFNITASYAVVFHRNQVCVSHLPRLNLVGGGMLHHHTSISILFFDNTFQRKIAVYSW